MPSELPATLWPEYCCAILRDGAGRYLMEVRPPHERRVSGWITCFGGGRNEDEHPDACIRRELAEELGWAVGPDALEFCVRLVGTRDGRPREIAWFYRAVAPGPDVRLVTEPGVEAMWVEFEQTQETRVSLWHRAVIAAERAGETIARV